MMFYKPKLNESRPLVVALHSWTEGYSQSESVIYSEWAIANDCVFIHPHFTGSNVKPEATGSVLVIEDVLSAIEKRTTQTKELVFLVDQSLARNKDSEAITNVAAR